MWLKQSTQTDIVIGPIWSTTDGALKADLAYNAAGINCDIYKNGTKADITLANSSGNGYFRAGSGEAQYILTLSTTDTNTLGRARITLSATGFYMKPQDFLVVPANVWDSLFGSDKLQVDVTQIGDAALSTSSAQLGVNVVNWKGSAAAAMTGDAYARLGAPAGASVSADVAAVKAETAAIVADTNELQGDWANGGRLDLIVDGILEDTGTTLDALIKDVPTVAEFEARTLVAADYVVVGDTIARVTLVDTCTTNTDMVAAAPSAASVADAVLDEAMAGHVAAGSLGKAVADVLEDTATTLPATLATIDGIVDDILVDTATIGAPAGASVSADIAAVKAETAAIVADTNELQTDWANGGRLDLILDAAGAAGDPWATAIPGAYGAGTAGLMLGTTLPNAITTIDGIVDDILVDTATIGAPAGASVSADIAAIKAETAAILEDTATTLPATLATIDGIVDDILVDTAVIGALGAGLTNIPWNAAWDAEVQSECTDALNAYDPPTKAELDSGLDAVPTATENADALLNRDMSAVSDTTARSPLNALRSLRNKASISAGTLTVCKEDDATSAWTATVTTDADAEPITVVDPA